MMKEYPKVVWVNLDEESEFYGMVADGPADGTVRYTLYNDMENESRGAPDTSLVGDLMEALEGVVSEYDEPDNGRSLRWAVDHARAVIAKAKGEAE